MERLKSGTAERVLKMSINLVRVQKSNQKKLQKRGAATRKINKIIPIVFIVVAAVIVVFLVVRLFSKANGQHVLPRARVVTPTSGSDTGNQSVSDGVEASGETLTSFISLAPSETLISVLSIDMNSDRFEDQVIAVRRENVPHLVIVVGMYEPDSNTYVRVAEITTGISRVRTFSFTGIDMTGEHRNDLVYQGVKDDGTSVMAIYTIRRVSANFELVKIGEFESDGTIFIQQDDRSLSYELSQTRGASFPVWVYSSAQDESGGENASLSQIQTEYRWNETEQQYVETRQIRVTGSRIAAQELARIQDGTVDTFAGFLHGLWYKTANTQDGIRYIFFDYTQKEVIFLYNDTEEVYSWEDSNLRRSGIYISTTNESITNMQRRCDISLLGIDEVNLRVIDDVRMIIKESKLWDGRYRKMTVQSAYSGEQTRSVHSDYVAQLVNGPAWMTDNGFRMTFSDSSYTLSSNAMYDSGTFLTGVVGNSAIIQFRSSSRSAILSEVYQMSFNTVTVPATSRHPAEVQIDYNTLYLEPVRLSPDAVYAAEGRALTLTRESD